MTDNQPNENLSCLPIDAAQKSARDAPKGLRFVKPDDETPEELTWEEIYAGVAKRAPESEEFAATKRYMDAYLDGYRGRARVDRRGLWDRFLCKIGWHRHKAIRDIKRLEKKMRAEGKL